MTSSQAAQLAPDWLQRELAALLTETESVIISGLRGPSRALASVEETARLGGKRARAILSGLSGLASGAPREVVLCVSAVVEMVHAATLVHDDVIDASLERRGRPSAHVLVGNKRAVLGGDALLTAGLRMLTQRKLFREVDSLLDCISQMVEGEYLQLERQFRLPPDIPTAERVNRLKTGVLFGWSTSACLAYMGAPEAQIRSAYEVGLAIGDAFQGIDDLLDIFGDPAVTGKPTLQDLREGKITPTMGRLLLERPALCGMVEAYWRALLRADDERELVLPIVQAAREAHLERDVRAKAQERLSEGLSYLSVFPGRPYAEALRGVAESLLIRQR